MTSVVLPLVYYAVLSIGRTIDLRNYASIANDLPTSIFNKDAIEEIPVNHLNSTYYVVPGRNYLPRIYSQLGLPIDLVFNMFPGTVYTHMLDQTSKYLSNKFSDPGILTVTDYTKVVRRIKDDAKPISGWQSKSNIPNNHTHYFDKLHYGGRAVSYTRIFSDVLGDEQIFKRILEQVMGQSGSVGEDTLDMWKRALKEIYENEDVRGRVVVSHVTLADNADLPREMEGDLESFLKQLPEFPKYVRLRDGPIQANPIYVTLKPLHDLDQRYDVVRKNVVTERYLLKLKELFGDLQRTYMAIKFNEGNEKFNEFYKKFHSASEALTALRFRPQGIYSDLNLTEYDNGFRTYYRHLDNSTEDYYTDYQRLVEKIYVKCKDEFLKSFKGSLLVEADEVVKINDIDLSECREKCVEVKSCRAFGYAEKARQCLIYDRSTRSAKILFPTSSSFDMKVYDRKCERTY